MNLIVVAIILQTIKRHVKSLSTDSRLLSVRRPDIGMNMIESLLIPVICDVNGGLIYTISQTFGSIPPDIILTPRFCPYRNGNFLDAIWCENICHIHFKSSTLAIDILDADLPFGYRLSYLHRMLGRSDENIPVFKSFIVKVDVISSSAVLMIPCFYSHTVSSVCFWFGFIPSQVILSLFRRPNRNQNRFQPLWTGNP